MLLVQGGRVVTAETERDADILIVMPGTETSGVPGVLLGGGWRA